MICVFYARACRPDLIFSDVVDAGVVMEVTGGAVMPVLLDCALQVSQSFIVVFITLQNQMTKVSQMTI